MSGLLTQWLYGLLLSLQSTGLFIEILSHFAVYGRGRLLQLKMFALKDILKLQQICLNNTLLSYDFCCELSLDTDFHLSLRRRVS